MGRASKKLPAGALVGAAALALGLVLPQSAPRASSHARNAGPSILGLGCAPAETPVGVDGPGLLARVRADDARAKPAASGRPPTPRKAHRPAEAAPRAAAKAPPPPRAAVQEPRANVLRSFYTCNATSNPAEGTGWRLVGPLRQG